MLDLKDKEESRGQMARKDLVVNPEQLVCLVQLAVLDPKD
jgi:hypothetical protein